LKPSCSRCSRLDIPCIGSGQQRYKFLHEDGASPSSNTKPSQRGRKISSSSSSSSSGASRSLSRTPSNGQSLLANVLVSKLKAKDDLRYHLTWTYGSILEDIPKRLGTNAALDTAVNALVCAHTHHAATQGALPDSESLTKYIHAVKTLRHCLDDPVKAREANTLCAIYLLMICHVCNLMSRLTCKVSLQGSCICSLTRSKALRISCQLQIQNILHSRRMELPDRQRARRHPSLRRHDVSPS